MEVSQVADSVRAPETGRERERRASSGRSRPTAFVFYHYFPPDEVVSAVHFGDLSAGLVSHGWAVKAFPCVWGCRDDSTQFSSCEDWKGVAVQRIWRPRFQQSSKVGRILNAIWMIIRWSLLALRRRDVPDVVLVGTDPIFSVLIALVWKTLHPRTQIVHWCFDLYLEAATAEGIVRPDSLTERILSRLLHAAYRRCSLLADLGPCMRTRLARYSSSAKRQTLVPWAIDEPVEPPTLDSQYRENIFGKTNLALLYSGSFGFAHSYEEILDLAASFSRDEARLAFCVGGNRQADLRHEIDRKKLDIPVFSFAKINELRPRLACADVHVVTLRKEWTGMVVPSKFFGALSAGRPVLFAGSPESTIAQWICEFQVGWILSAENLPQIREELLRYSMSAAEQAEMQARCFAVYRAHFSREVQIDRWNDELCSLLADCPKKVPQYARS